MGREEKRRRRRRGRGREEEEKKSSRRIQRYESLVLYGIILPKTRVC